MFDENEDHGVNQQLQDIENLLSWYGKWHM